MPGQPTPSHTIRPTVDMAGVTWLLECTHGPTGWTGTDEFGRALPEDGTCWLQSWWDEQGEDLLRPPWPKTITFPALVIATFCNGAPDVFLAEAGA